MVFFRISAGADKKRKIKHRKLKYNYRGSKRRHEKLKDMRKLGKEQETILNTDESKNKTIPTGKMTS